MGDRENDVLGNECMRTKKAQQKVDFRKLVEEKRMKNEVHITLRAIEHCGLSQSTHPITVGYERVKNYSMNIYTIRCEGVLLLRRFPLDLEGFCFRYESPIFNDINNLDK